MKSKVKYFLITVVSIGLGYSQSLESTLQDMLDKNAKGYLGPMVTTFGMCMNSGTYHIAKPHKFLGFDFKVNASITAVTDAGKTYDFYLPDENMSVPITIGSEELDLSISPDDIYEEDRVSSTMFGDEVSNTIEVDNTKLENAIIDQLTSKYSDLTEEQIRAQFSSEISAAIDNAPISAITTPLGLNIPAVGLPIGQVSIGLPMDIEISLRGLPSQNLGNIGKLSLNGFGGKIGLNQFIPIPNLVLPYFSAGYYRTNLSIGNLLEMKNSITTLQVSKSIPVITLYGGIGLEKSSLDINYTFNDGSTDIPISFNMEGENKLRTNIGLRLKLLLLSINADYNMGEYNTVNIGVGLTLR